MGLSVRLAAVVCLTAAGSLAMASECLQVAGIGPVRDAPVVVRVAHPGEHGPVEISFVGHATFRIETPSGVAAVTDFAGFWGVGDVPDVVTMNKAHSTHWTASPDPRIANVLPGWNPLGGEAQHYLTLDDLVVRNVATDIRRWDGEVEPFGNSIFIFEVAGLCIGHLGHLHHKLTDQHYGLIGRLDVVMAPVDGGYTMNQAAMIEVLQRLRARIVLPMHWFGPANLERFLAGMTRDYAVLRIGSASITVSHDTLPDRPTVMVLDGH